MSFRDSFPGTAALWRLIASRPARILLVSFASIVILTIIGFRIESLLFQRRANSLLLRMAQLRLDNSSEGELRAILPELRPLSPESADEPVNRYALIIDNMQHGSLPRALGVLHLDSDSVVRLLFLLGHRFHRFDASASLRDGKVVRVTYNLWLENGESHGLYDGVGVHVRMFSRAGWVQEEDRAVGPTYNDVSPYAEEVASNAPDNVVDLALTSDAPTGLVRAALDPHIGCMWKQGSAKIRNRFFPEFGHCRFRGEVARMDSRILAMRAKRLNARARTA